MVYGEVRGRDTSDRDDDVVDQGCDSGEAPSDVTESEPDVDDDNQT